MPMLTIILSIFIGATGFVQPNPAQAEQAAIKAESSHPVVETPCHEDEIGMVMRYDFEPAAHQRGFWDGDRFFRLCVPLDNLTVVDGELRPVYED